MELHFVLQSSGGQLAVIGILVVEGADNPNLAMLISNFPAGSGQSTHPSAEDLHLSAYLPTDLTIGPYDVKLGEVGGVPFYISKSQYDYWKHTQLILDVIEGSGGTFSLEGNTGKAFHTRSRLFTDEEWAEIEAQVLHDLA